MSKPACLVVACLVLSGCDSISALIYDEADLNRDGTISHQESEEYTLAKVQFEYGMWTFRSQLEPVTADVPVDLVQALIQATDFELTECFEQGVPGQAVYDAEDMELSQIEQLVRVDKYKITDGWLEASYAMSFEGMTQHSKQVGELLPASITLVSEDALSIPGMNRPPIRIAYSLTGERISDC